MIGAGVIVTRSSRRKRRQSKGGDKRGGRPPRSRLRHPRPPRREVRHDRALAGRSERSRGPRPRHRVRDLAAGARAGAGRRDGHRRQQVGRHDDSLRGRRDRRRPDARQDGGHEDGVWLHSSRSRRRRPKPDPKADPKAPPSRRPSRPRSPPPRDLPGAENARKLYDQFAPLASLRAFGVLDANKLKELGLDNPKRKLEVTVKGDGAPLRHRAAGGADLGRGVPARHPRRTRLPDAAQHPERAAERRPHGRPPPAHASSSPTSIASSSPRAASRRSSSTSAGNRAPPRASRP